MGLIETTRNEEYVQIIYFYCDNHKKPIKTLGRQNSWFYIVTTGDKYNNYHALKQKRPMVQAGLFM
jgi:hypothetical protein